MASAVIGECSICESVIFANEKMLTTSCQHDFHRTCAVERMEKKNRTDCYKCAKPSGITDALKHEQSAIDTECKICESLLDRDDDTITTSCQHVFHRSCALERVNKKRQTKCRKCGEASAIVNALLHDILPSNSECKICEKTLDNSDDILITDCRHAFHRSCAEERAKTRDRTDCHRCGHPSVIEIQPQSFQDTNEDSNMDLPSASSRRARITTMDMYGPETRVYSPVRGRSPSPVRREAIVYIDNLPLSIKDDMTILEDMIANRIRDTLNFRPIEVKCYSKLGVGFVRVRDDEKDRLLQLDSMSINRRDPSIIFFSELLEIVSYIVISPTNGIDWPSPEDLLRQLSKTFPGEQPYKCEVVNGIFPNIYRIYSTSFEQLLMIMSNPDFSIQGHCARVFLNGNCSYFEDLPKSIDDESLRQAISNKLGESNLSRLDLHLEFDQSKKNVCIIAANIARAWSTANSLSLGDKHLMKKENLTCRLLLHPVPKDVDINTIVNHHTFAGKATVSKRYQKNLILEISDKNLFENSLRIGVLRVNDQMVIPMKIYIPFTDPEENEIDGNTWYDKEMHEHPSNILGFIDNLEHPIFHYKWNPQAWIKQFQLIASQNRGMNDQRHKLRVTVMLNTIATIRKKKYQIGERVFDLHLNSNIKTIVYNHQSKLQITPPTALPPTPYRQTIIKVKNQDCLLVYEELVNQGKHPVLLNMASAISPGGGYRKGDGAQEENLFRRSDYFRSLDVELDRITDYPTSERYYCTSTGDFQSNNFNPDEMYPMNKYGAIYTSGLTVFRRPEDTGYTFMEKPLTNVCTIAMAAYREPKLVDGNQLTDKHAIGTRKKIENIFAIAHHHKHDCLVLSAFGCGAYRNPPEHMAKIFQSVIEQYAGFFEEIIFAIIDDHNTGNNLNPQGNFLPFQRQFDRQIIQAIIPTYQPNTIFGPYRFLDDGTTVNDVSICDLLPCKYGAHCNNMDSSSHRKEYSHPPWCTKASSNEECSQINDSVHSLSFIHRKTCMHGGKCRNIDEKEHCQTFDHPPFCSKGGDCQNTTDDHEKSYRHLPQCKESHQCTKYKKKIESHCEQFRHCKLQCKHGHFCADFHNQTHMDEFDHPFTRPCPWTPYNCKYHDMLTQKRDNETLPKQVEAHCLDFAHVCRFGRNCHDQKSVHWEKSIHLARLPCPYADQCNKLLQEDHLNSFTHPKIHDLRRQCKHTDKCYTRSDRSHVALYRHGMTFGDSAIIPYYHLNANINFVQNQKEIIACVIRYMNKENWEKSETISNDIINWIRTVQPVHRCQQNVFESIMYFENVMSREYMMSLDKIKPAVDSFFQQFQIRQIQALDIDTYKKWVYQYVNAVVTEEYNKCKFLAKNPTSGNYSTPVATEKFIEKRRNMLSNVMEHDFDIKALTEMAICLAKASYELQSQPCGIAYPVDEILKTNKHVFSILGPHLGSIYGNIVIIFKREVLHHPDANFSIQAGTSYHSGNTFLWRPWLGNAPSTEDDRVKKFHSSKLHPSIPGYEMATALELIAMTNHGLPLKKKTMKITLDQILERWCQSDSHQVIEAHLPELIPLDYIDHIYMPENIWNSWDSKKRDYVQSIFKDRYTIKKCRNDQEYNQIISQELIMRFGKRDAHSLPRPIKGTVVTIPSTNFEGYCLLPLTISQAFEQYHIDHPQASKSHSTYIYWQAMNGDMMLTLSKEQINRNRADSSPRSLICYLAKKPSSMNTDGRYSEDYSYLNVGVPVQHDKFMFQEQFPSRSRSFYIGCNTDDYMTFCLEIQHSSGTVLLSHAGPNSFYNHETISCKVNKTDMDLSELNFIYIRAGKKPVPIRNLMICFEKQTNLHPTIDTKFDKESINQTNIDTQNNSGLLSRMGDAIKNAAHEIKETVIDLLSNNKDSSLKPCSDGIYCLQQFSNDGSDHNQTYSHPCRFAEQCRKPESNLTHEPHSTTACEYDRKCSKLSDPIHRARYRHTGLPYFLIPCRYKNRCTDQSDAHRMKYFHGEQVLETT